jgi:hypothetical protein
VKNIFLLWHVRADDPHKEDAKLIGTYASRELASAAISRLTPQPGFVDYPAGFEISDYEINKDHWSEGFVRS